MQLINTVYCRLVFVKRFFNDSEPCRYGINCCVAKGKSVLNVTKWCRLLRCCVKRPSNSQPKLLKPGGLPRTTKTDWQILDRKITAAVASDRANLGGHRRAQSDPPPWVNSKYMPMITMQMA